MKRFTNVFLLFLVAILRLIGTAYAVPFTATITADNHYAFYYGKGTGITYVGRNELGFDGSPGVYNWSQPEIFGDIEIPEGQYIYVVGWSDNATAQGWLGQFVSASKTILSDPSWEYITTNNDLGDGSPAPSPASVQAAVAGNLPWHTPVPYFRNNGDSPWGLISGISSSAEWIWGTPIEPGSGAGEFQIFRHAVSIDTQSVPDGLPTVVGLGLSLLCLSTVAKARIFW